MVTVTLELAEDGCLRSLRASGHAGGAALGTNVACAAVTVLLRTTARVLSVRGLVGEGGADAPGRMELSVSAERGAGPEWLRGVTDSLVRGVSDLAAEFPAEVALSIRY